MRRIVSSSALLSLQLHIDWALAFVEKHITFNQFFSYPFDLLETFFLFRSIGSRIKRSVLSENQSHMTPTPLVQDTASITIFSCCKITAINTNTIPPKVPIKNHILLCLYRRLADIAARIPIANGKPPRYSSGTGLSMITESNKIKIPPIILTRVKIYRKLHINTCGRKSRCGTVCLVGIRAGCISVY